MDVNKEVFAVIDERSPVYQDILRVFGTRRIPLVNALLIQNDAPDQNGALFFKVDPNRMTPEQIDKWAAWMAARFGLSTQDVLADMRNSDHGIPLLHSHVLKLEPEGTAPIYPRRLRLPNGAIDMRMFY